jgi:hypothetical protein
MSKTEAQSSPHAPAGEEQRAAPSLIQVMRQAWRALQERAGLHGWSGKTRNPKHDIRKSYRKRGRANQGAIVCELQRYLSAFLPRSLSMHANT